MRGTAKISSCERYRYALERTWDRSLPLVTFVLLNPSTADASLDDPTLRRGVGFAKSWGCGSLIFVNLFAYRATKPHVLKQVKDPIGPDNDVHVLAECKRARTVVLAWGTKGSLLGRDKAVVKLLADAGLGSRLAHLGLTKAGHPKHPLYLKSDTPLEKW